MMSQAWKVVKPHMPLIRFRKGGSDALKASINSPPKNGPGKAPVIISQKSTIEDYQLPLRYRRQALDEKEIDAINSGGAY